MSSLVDRDHSDVPPSGMAVSAASLIRGGKRIVDQASLNLQAGEVLGILGPNGAGKSSLIKLMSGEHQPDAGRVYLDGQELSRWPRAELARRRAVLPQQLDVAFGFTAWEVALLGRIPHHRGIPSRLDREITWEAMQQVDAADLADQRYQTLSGGERARVQLARVLAQVWSDNPHGQVILLDEPSAPMDVAHQLALSKQLRDLASAGYAIGVIVHDLNLAASVCDRVAFMKSGQVLHVGTPQSVFRPDILAEVFAVNTEVTFFEQRPHVRLLSVLGQENRLR